MLLATGDGHSELLDSSAYISNVIFDNFRQNYTGSSWANSVAQQCSNNFAFRPNPMAIDATSGHYLTATTCTNCDANSFIYCDPNSNSYLGYFGGCGDMVCTGMSNYLLLDWNGTFLGTKATIIPNSVIGSNEANCTFNTIMNGYLCKRTDFVALEF